MRNWHTLCFMPWLYHVLLLDFWLCMTPIIWQTHRLKISTRCTLGQDQSQWDYSFCNSCLDFSRKYFQQKRPDVILKYRTEFLFILTGFQFACAAKKLQTAAVVRWSQFMRVSDWLHLCWLLDVVSVDLHRKPFGHLSIYFKRNFVLSNL